MNRIYQVLAEEWSMEERQIQEFVHQALMDRAANGVLAYDLVGVIQSGGYTPRVVEILLRLVPYLTSEQPMSMGEKWWHA